MTTQAATPFRWKEFIKMVALIAIPVALQNLLTTTGSMVDCYWGFVGGGMLFFAQYYGAGDEDGIDRSFGLTLVCMMTMAFLFAIAAIFFPHIVMRVYTDKTTIQEIGVSYLKIVGFAYPMQVYSMAMSSLLRSTDRVRIPLYAAIASVLTNILFNWILIYGNLGAPAMGIRGAALATVLAAFVNMIVVLILAKIQGYPYLFQVRKHFIWKKDKVKEYFIKCFPIICNEFLIGLGNMVINIVLGRQPEEAIAAVAVFRTLEGLVIGFFAGFSSAASVVVGTRVGAGELDTAYERAKRLVLLCGSTIFVLCLLLLAFHTPILHAMSLQGESFKICTGMLIIYCIAAVIRMCNWTQNDTYRAAGDARYGTILEIVFMWCMVVPAVWLTGMKLHTAFLVTFGCCYIDEIIRFVLMQIHMYSGRWVKPVTPEGQAALPEFRAKHERKKS